MQGGWLLLHMLEELDAKDTCHAILAIKLLEAPQAVISAEEKDDFIEGWMWEQ